MANKDLNKARTAKKDEFHTRLDDIEFESAPPLLPTTLLSQLSNGKSES